MRYELDVVSIKISYLHVLLDNKFCQIDMNDLPRVLVVTHQSVCPAHGTGAVLLRHFDRYDPDKLANVCVTNDGEPPWACTIEAKKKIVRRGSLSWAKNAIQKRLHRVLRAAGFNFAFAEAGCQYEPLCPRLEAIGFRPDLIYSNCFGRFDLALSLQLVNEFRGDIPVIQHFQDYEPDAEGEVYRILEKLLPRCDVVWALADGIAEELKNQFGCSAEIINIFKTKVTPDFKQRHRPMDNSFKVVILGNVYYPAIFEDVRSLWRFVRQRLPGLGPIEWIGHPLQVERCAILNVNFEPEVKYVGFREAFSRETRGQLHDELLRADVALVPFNREASPENPYARYSIPSRVTELAMAGLPMFCMAGPGTDVRRFIEGHGIGVCANASEGETMYQRFWELLCDHELRAKLGFRARRLAEQEFDLEQYQPKFYDRLRDIAIRHRSQRGPGHCRSKVCNQ